MNRASNREAISLYQAQLRPLIYVSVQYQPPIVGIHRPLGHHLYFLFVSSIAVTSASAHFFKKITRSPIYVKSFYFFSSMHDLLLI